MCVCVWLLIISHTASCNFNCPTSVAMVCSLDRRDSETMGKTHWGNRTSTSSVLVCVMCVPWFQTTHMSSGVIGGEAWARECGAFCDYVTMWTDTLREAPVVHAGIIPIFCWSHLWVHCGGTWWVPIRCQRHGNTDKGESSRTNIWLNGMDAVPCRKDRYHNIRPFHSG